MQVSKINISSILGIDQLEFEPGKATQITGKNGTGKTSILTALRSALQTGHDATLIRKGEEKGEIVLVLDDGTTIKKTVKKDDTSLELRDPAGKKMARPAEQLKSLVNSISVNPVSFLLAPEKDKVRVLLESMPLVADTDRLEEITGGPITADTSMHALDVIAVIHKQFYDDRTGTNRAIKEKQATINQIKHALPQLPEGVAVADENQLRADVDAARAALQDTLAGVDKKLSDAKAKNVEKATDLRAANAKQIAELQAQIEAIKLQEVADLAVIAAKEATLSKSAAEARERYKDEATQQITPKLDQLNLITSHREQVAKFQQSLEYVATMEAELQTLVQDADHQSAVLAKLDDYKLELVKNLPIPGLVVENGRIYRDGVAFDHLNTAQQVMISVEIAKLRAGELKVVVVDGLELLDAESFNNFARFAEESDLQLFVTRVEDTDLEIKPITTQE